MCAGQELEVVQEEAPGTPTHPKQAAVVCTAAKTDAEDQLTVRIGRRQTKARSLDDGDDPTWRPPHTESVCAQRRKALCIVPVSPQDQRVVKFGHQEVQNVTVGVLQHEQFSVSGRRRSG